MLASSTPTHPGWAARRDHWKGKVEREQGLCRGQGAWLPGLDEGCQEGGHSCGKWVGHLGGAGTWGGWIEGTNMCETCHKVPHSGGHLKVLALQFKFMHFIELLFSFCVSLPNIFPKSPSYLPFSISSLFPSLPYLVLCRTNWENIGLRTCSSTKRKS